MFGGNRKRWKANGDAGSDSDSDTEVSNLLLSKSASSAQHSPESSKGPDLSANAFREWREKNREKPMLSRGPPLPPQQGPPVPARQQPGRRGSIESHSSAGDRRGPPAYYRDGPSRDLPPGPPGDWPPRDSPGGRRRSPPPGMPYNNGPPSAGRARPPSGDFGRPDYDQRERGPNGGRLPPWERPRSRSPPGGRGGHRGGPGRGGRSRSNSREREQPKELRGDPQGRWAAPILAPAGGGPVPTPRYDGGAGRAQQPPPVDRAVYPPPPPAGRDSYYPPPPRRSPSPPPLRKRLGSPPLLNRLGQGPSQSPYSAGPPTPSTASDDLAYGRGEKRDYNGQDDRPRKLPRRDQSPPGGGRDSFPPRPGQWQSNAPPVFQRDSRGPPPPPPPGMPPPPFGVHEPYVPSSGPGRLPLPPQDFAAPPDYRHGGTPAYGRDAYDRAGPAPGPGMAGDRDRDRRGSREYPPPPPQGRRRSISPPPRNWPPPPRDYGGPGGRGDYGGPGMPQRGPPPRGGGGGDYRGDYDGPPRNDFRGGRDYQPDHRDPYHPRDRDNGSSSRPPPLGPPPPAIRDVPPEEGFIISLSPTQADTRFLPGPLGAVLDEAAREAAPRAIVENPRARHSYVYAGSETAASSILGLDVSAPGSGRATPTADRPERKCFNCGEAHLLSDCPVPLDQRRVQRNRREFLDDPSRQAGREDRDRNRAVGGISSGTGPERGGGGRDGGKKGGIRWTENGFVQLRDPAVVEARKEERKTKLAWTREFRPGQVSEELRRALAMQRREGREGLEKPPWLGMMALWGYAPGWEVTDLPGAIHPITLCRERIHKAGKERERDTLHQEDDDFDWDATAVLAIYDGLDPLPAAADALPEAAPEPEATEAVVDAKEDEEPPKKEWPTSQPPKRRLAYYHSDLFSSRTLPVHWPGMHFPAFNDGAAGSGVDGDEPGFGEGDAWGEKGEVSEDEDEE